MKYLGIYLVGVLIILFGGTSIWAQQTSPDIVLYNGKIVTVSDHGVNANLGTIAQAIAIREGKIVAVGSNTDIRRLAVSNSQSLDLGGRTVIPGFGATHDHPMDWDPLNPYIVRKVVTDDMHIERFFNDPADKVIQEFPRVFDEAVHKAKPGQWIRISLLFGPEYLWGKEITALLGRQITKQMLDMGAPNNPVIIRAGFTGVLLNQKAIEETKAFYGDQWDKFVGRDVFQNANIAETGTCGTCYREIEQDVLYPPEALKEIYRLGLSWMTGYGQTLNASALYSAGAIRAYHELDRTNQMAMRFAWAWYWEQRGDFFFDPYFSQALASREGKGSDYLWFAGMAPAHEGRCSELPGTSPEVKQRERPCGYAQPMVNRALYEYVKAGGRLVGDHITKDGEVDVILDTIEKASKDAGMTPDQIRAKRHGMEHMAMWPRPDQIPRIKDKGILVSGWDLSIWEEGSWGRDILKDYGERGANQVIPRKNLYDAGVMNSVEIDRPIAATNLTYFNVLYSGITRKDRDGQLLAPQQAISREPMLKSATLFAGYYVKREDKIGSLEPGKFADLVVLDRDYLTVPVDDILKIRVLMTMVGGKVRHLVPSLARQWGMQPTGAQVELGGSAAQW